MIPTVDVVAPNEISSALTRLGRTEDVRFSPTGRRLAIAGFGHNQLYVLDVDVTGAGATLAVRLNGLTRVSSGSLQEPHGLCFLDDHTVAVANRDAEVPILRLPSPVQGIRGIEVEPLQTLRADEVHGLKAPGSVAASRLAPDVYEIMVCNNFADNVSRHIVDARDNFGILRSEVLLRSAIELPDGVALSNDGRWLAISNHNTHNVLLYRYTEHLGPDSKPDGVLENVNYPHGLSFTADDAHLIVADAGAPYVHAFGRGDADWDGTRQPIASTRIMDDDVFFSGRYNVQEGGPKGIDIDCSMRVVVVSSEHQSLAFFDAGQLVPGIVASEARQPSDERCTGESTRAALVRALRTSADESAEVAGLGSALADSESRIADLEQMISHRDASWAELEAHALELQRRLTLERDEARLVGDYHRRVAADRELQLDAVHASTSWRITTIPRAVIDRLRRRR